MKTKKEEHPGYTGWRGGLRVGAWVLLAVALVFVCTGHRVNVGLGVWLGSIVGWSLAEWLRGTAGVLLAQTKEWGEKTDKEIAEWENAVKLNYASQMELLDACEERALELGVTDELREVVGAARYVLGVDNDLTPDQATSILREALNRLDQRVVEIATTAQAMAKEPTN